MSEEVTQQIIDVGVNQKRVIAKMLDESEMLIATNKDARQFLREYEMMREAIKNSGWELPDLVDVLKVGIGGFINNYSTNCKI